MARGRHLAAISISAVLLALLVAACGSTSFSAGTYQVATAKVKSDAHLTALLGGVLHGRMNADYTACLWVGEGRDATALFWPYGYTAGGKPLTVYDDAGQRVAVVGQTVRIGGGLMPDAVHSIIGCKGFTNFWIVAPTVEAE